MQNITRNIQISLLLVATLGIMSGITVVSSLPLISQTFSDIPHIEFLSKLMLTIPSIIIALFAPFAGHIVDRWGRLKPLYVGILLFVLGGSSGFYLQDFYAILLGRAVLGFAVALIMTSSTALIGDYFDEEAIHSLKPKKITEIFNQNIGFIFQAYHLLDDLTVYENIETPLLYKKVKSSERKALVADILDRFNIVGKKDLFPHQLSGGQQQLVGIARALIIKPKLILADEPTGNLNSKQSNEIMQLFKDLNEEGVTVIQATHSESNATYGSRTINLLDGSVQKS